MRAGEWATRHNGGEVLGGPKLPRGHGAPQPCTFVFPGSPFVPSVMEKSHTVPLRRHRAQPALLLVISQRLMILCVNSLLLMLCFCESMVSHPGSVLLLVSPHMYTDT